jgi:hypothetical protein
MNPNLKIVCPHCRQSSDSIKRQNIMLVIFLFIGASWQMEQVTACDKCMRQRILVNALINILSANILWPFLILPNSLYNLYLTLEPGHSESVIEEIRLTTQQPLYSRLGNEFRNPAPPKQPLSKKLGDLSEQQQWKSSNNPPQE